MICNKCNSSGVYNEVMGKGYYYCRTCKDEIVLESIEMVPSEQKAFYKLVNKNWALTARGSEAIIPIYYMRNGMQNCFVLPIESNSPPTNLYDLNYSKSLTHWIPDEEPKQGDSFMGNDRSMCPQSYSGHILRPLPSLCVHEVLHRAIYDMGFLAPSHCFLPEDKYRQLEKEPGIKVHKLMHDGLECINMPAPFGCIKVFMDTDCPPNRGYLLNLSRWYLDPRFGLYTDMPRGNAVILFD